MKIEAIRRQFYENFTFRDDNGCHFNKLTIPGNVFNWVVDKLTPKTRTSAQNRALHKYYKMISDQLNNAGYTREVQIINKIVEVPYTETYIKEFWRTIQLYMFDIKSTRDINTEIINQIIDVFSKHFGERGIYVEFPSFQAFLNKLDSNY